MFFLRFSRVCATLPKHNPNVWCNMGFGQFPLKTNVPSYCSLYIPFRAMYQDADIYLLDDPLAAVDGKVGNEIFQK